MQRYFQVQDGTGLYHQTHPWPGGNLYSYLWEFSRALVATLAIAGIRTDVAPAVSRCFAALERYWDRRSRPPAYDSYVLAHGGGDKYHDDNAWVALAFVQQYRMGLSASLDRAKLLFAFAQSGWDITPSDPRPGGVFWVKQGEGIGLTNHDRGAGATAGNGELGLHLHALTGSTEFHGGGEAMVSWVQQHLYSGDLYYNVARIDGSIDTNLWSYNQGVMIGANVLRFQLTGNAQYLQRAAATATKALTTYGDFQGQPPSFNVMLFQNMLQLYPHVSATLQESMLEAMRAYADWGWNTPSARDAKTNLFYFNDAGQPVGGSRRPAQLRDQGAMTQLYALLAWPSENYGMLT